MRNCICYNLSTKIWDGFMVEKKLQSYIRDAHLEQVKDFTKDGQCSCCGECCKDIIVSDFNEIMKIRKFVKQRNIRPQVHPVGPNSVDMTCPFLNWDTHMCNIYPVRPKICKEFLCSKSREEINTSRERIAQIGTVLSLRKEIFGDDSHIRILSLAIAAQGGLFYDDGAANNK